MGKRFRRLLLCASLTLGGVGGAATAPGEAHAESATDLKAQGDAAFRDRRYSDAIKAYDRAYQIGKLPTVLYNKGRAHEALEQYPEALEAIERFADEAPPAVRAKVSGLSELLASLRSRVATVAVGSNVPGAKVTIRDVVIGETSDQLVRRRVNSGRARIVVEKDGYESFAEERDLPADATTVIKATLAPRETRVTVTIRSTPPRASARIDRHAVGMTPVDAQLEPGTHTLELELEGHDKVTTSFVIEPDKPRSFDLELPSSPTVLSRWWFWTAVGTVVAGGVVLGYVALQDKPVPHGSIAPGTVSAPLRILP